MLGFSIFLVDLKVYIYLKQYMNSVIFISEFNILIECIQSKNKSMQRENNKHVIA